MTKNATSIITGMMMGIVISLWKGIPIIEIVMVMIFILIGLMLTDIHFGWFVFGVAFHGFLVMILRLLFDSDLFTAHIIASSLGGILWLALYGTPINVEVFSRRKKNIE